MLNNNEGNVMCTTLKDQINEDLLEFIKVGKMAKAA